ncbi:MAG: hypothetical protein ACM3TU_03410 [Bacillota bacterium]
MADCANDIEFLRREAEHQHVDELTANAQIVAYQASIVEGKEHKPFFIIPFERAVMEGKTRKHAGEEEQDSPNRLSRRERRRMERKRSKIQRH